MDVIDFEEKRKKRDCPEITKDNPPIKQRPWHEKREMPHGQCQHIRVYVDEEKLLLECQDCGENINPVWWIAQQMRQENNLWRRRNQIDELNEKLTKKLAKQNRVKCKHCGKLTPIHEDVFFEEHINEKQPNP